jgi:hypothetical protein
MKKLVLSLILVSASLYGQVGQYSAINLVAGPPPTVSNNSLSAKVVGTPGTTTYYYWVTSNYASGQSSLAGPVSITTANATLSGSNYVQINFGTNGAASYAVLRTTTNVAPINGTATNAVVTASTTNTVNDQSNSLNSFTLNIITSANASIYLDNTNYSEPQITLVGANLIGGIASVISGTSLTLQGGVQYAVCTGTCNVTPPIPVAGYQYCVRNAPAISTVITINAIGNGVLYEKTDNTGYGTASTGTMVSSGAIGDKICIVGLDSTHYIVSSYLGGWTVN